MISIYIVRFYYKYVSCVWKLIMTSFEPGNEHIQCQLHFYKIMSWF